MGKNKALSALTMLSDAKIESKLSTQIRIVRVIFYNRISVNYENISNRLPMILYNTHTLDLVHNDDSTPGKRHRNAPFLIKGLHSTLPPPSTRCDEATPFLRPTSLGFRPVHRTKHS
jgi:hypothetical protein